ncbi:hypothetical protein AB0G67_17855 [Streptomyces sp. NPDC021056]
MRELPHGPHRPTQLRDTRSARGGANVLDAMGTWAMAVPDPTADVTA